MLRPRIIPRQQSLRSRRHHRELVVLAGEIAHCAERVEPHNPHELDLVPEIPPQKMYPTVTGDLALGNPHEDRFDSVLQTVMDGRYDADLNRQVEPKRQAAANARKMRNWRMCFKLLDDIIETDPHVFAFTTLDRFEVIIVDQKDPDRAYEYARQLLNDYADDPGLLEALARKIATDPKIVPEQREMEIAMDAANAMGAATGKETPKVYAVQAMIHYHAGRLDEAIDLQKKAYFMARPKQKAGFKRVLRDYQEAAQREKVKAETGG